MQSRIDTVRAICQTAINDDPDQLRAISQSIAIDLLDNGQAAIFKLAFAKKSKEVLMLLQECNASLEQAVAGFILGHHRNEIYNLIPLIKTRDRQTQITCHAIMGDRSHVNYLLRQRSNEVQPQDLAYAIKGYFLSQDIESIEDLDRVYDEDRSYYYPNFEHAKNDEILALLGDTEFIKKYIETFTLNLSSEKIMEQYITGCIYRNELTRCGEFVEHFEKMGNKRARNIQLKYYTANGNLKKVEDYLADKTQTTLSLIEAQEAIACGYAISGDLPNVVNTLTSLNALTETQRANQPSTLKLKLITLFAAHKHFQLVIQYYLIRTHVLNMATIIDAPSIHDPKTIVVNQLMNAIRLILSNPKKTLCMFWDIAPLSAQQFFANIQVNAQTLPHDTAHFLLRLPHLLQLRHDMKIAQDTVLRMNEFDLNEWSRFIKIVGTHLTPKMYSNINAIIKTINRPVPTIVSPDLPESNDDKKRTLPISNESVKKRAKFSQSESHLASDKLKASAISGSLYGFYTTQNNAINTGDQVVDVPNKGMKRKESFAMPR